MDDIKENAPDPPQEAPETSSLQPSHPIHSQEEQLPLLVAEDEPVNRLVIRKFLDRLGHSTDVVATGGEALTALEEKEYALVFMDCQLPDMRGTEVTAAIRSLATGSLNRDVPIVALTADLFTGERERLLAAGMNDYVAKPYDLDTIRRVLVKWLGKQKTGVREIFNGDELLARHYDDHALAAELVHLFAENAPVYLSAIARAVKAGDPAGARLYAHTLKGAAATVGALRISAVAADLEKAAEEGAINTAIRLRESLSEEFELLLTVLAGQGWLKSHAAL